MVDAVRNRLGTGLLAMLASCAMFSTSGPFAKALITSGWSPSAIVLLRITGAALVLMPLAVVALRGRWGSVRRELPFVALYGALAVAGAQLGYFQAIERLTVGVSLLLEYLGIILVVLTVWVLTRRPPHRLTVLGVVVAIAGLALVLDITGAVSPDMVGVLWALFAAAGLAGHYVLAARQTAVPAVAFAGLGLGVGAVVLAVLSVARILPTRMSTAMIDLGGMALPPWLAIAELVLIAAVFAYVLAIVAARHLGSTLASVLGLSEVLFAILFAWLLLGELPRPIQLVGGALILGGVLAVRIGEGRRAAATAAAPVGDPATLVDA